MYTVLNAVVGYIFILFLVRVLGRRPGGQLTLSDFVLIFLVGGIIILATAGDDHSLTNCICGVATIGLMHRTVAYLRQHFPRFGAIVDGTPLVLLKRGEWQVEVMRRMRIDDADVMAAARTKGIRNLEQIKYAILERNGAISVIER
jgi:uncharacterized membrane protein YcaP (DUF421 family)